MNDPNMIPPQLGLILKSKSKGSNKLNFDQKIILALEWVQNSREKMNNIGIFRDTYGNLIVNPQLFGEALDIQPKSVLKNLSIFGYIKLETLEWGKWYKFTKNRAEIQQNPRTRIEEEWNVNITYLWQKFNREFKDCEAQSFDKFTHANYGGFTTLAQLIQLIYGTTQISEEIFRSLYFHFGPFHSISTKLPAIVLSVISRGWTFGSGNHTISLSEDNILTFTDNRRSVDLLNCDISAENPYWLKLRDGSEIDLDEFWMKYFPYTEQSYTYISEFAAKFLT